MEKIPFNKIKPGGFFHMKGKKALWQRRRDYSASAQMVSGRNIGQVTEPSCLVIPVNARIVEEK